LTPQQSNLRRHVLIEPGSSIVHARMRAALANLDEGEFTERHELDRKRQLPELLPWS
jgi:hypothetical protein